MRRVPNMPGTPNRNFRASDALWDYVQRMADEDGMTVTGFLLSLIVREARRRYPFERVPRR